MRKEPRAKIKARQNDLRAERQKRRKKETFLSEIKAGISYEYLNPEEWERQLHTQ